MNFLHHKDPFFCTTRTPFFCTTRTPFFCTTRASFFCTTRAPFFCTTRPTRTNRTNIFSRYWIHLFSCIFFSSKFFSSESVINVGDVEPAVTRSRKNNENQPNQPEGSRSKLRRKTKRQ